MIRTQSTPRTQIHLHPYRPRLLNPLELILSESRPHARISELKGTWKVHSEGARFGHGSMVARRILPSDDSWELVTVTCGRGTLQFV